MDRRTFLKQTGAAAAVTPLLNKEANAQAASQQIQHIIVVMMENRSFDHLFGWLPNANGQQAGLTYLDANGNPHSPWELAPDYTGCSYPDPDHSYAGGRTEYANGQMNGFLLTDNPGLNAIGYYQEKDLPFRSAIARNFVTCDSYFCSILGPTFPNRIFQHCGQTDRLGDDFNISTLRTIWDNLADQGISHKYYFNNLPFLALWGLKYTDITALYADFLADCAAGTLPAVSFVEPTFTTLTNLDEDDHPFSDVRNGDAFLAKTYHAIASSPCWQNTVVVFNFDEWGGFYDHVPPPRVTAPNSVDTDVDANGKVLLGFRVPCTIVSPWTVSDPNSPTVSHEVFDHTSVLKMIESVFGLPALAARETSSDVGNILDAIPLSKPPAAAPSLPRPGYVFPSSFCFSSISPSELPAGVNPALVPHSAYPRDDEEGTTFWRMINSGMLQGFPGHL